MALYVASVTLSAFLVFQVQPMVARRILPWFGGTPTVWSSVMLFFQVLLTGGYAYAHWLAALERPARQRRVHLAVLGVSVAVMLALGLMWPSPITPGSGWRPGGVDRPVLRIVLVLAVSVGLPYFTLASNTPLMQTWYRRRFAGEAPYWLYALSNAGSLLALLSYPVVVEPWLTLREQGWTWSGGYLLFALLTTAAAWLVSKPGQAAGEGDGRGEPEFVTAPTPPTPGGIQALWLALSATASVLLLAVTGHITQDVAVIPFLWVLPLAVYLLTFVLAFSGTGHYNRPLFSLLLAVASIAFVQVLGHAESGVAWQVAFYAASLFVVCMVMHGELYRLRPDPSHLTHFYLIVSVGGALGGILVTLVAPAVFTGTWELYLGWAMAWLLLAVLTFVRKTTELPDRWRFGHDAGVGGLALAAIGLAGYAIFSLSSGDLLRERNFYGVLRVRQLDNPRMTTMVHGVTLHGSQFIDPAVRDTPTTYFWKGSGIGLVLTHHPRHAEGLRVGVLGLGVGTLAAYGQLGDVYRFYEINPLVARLAGGQGGYFSFLKDSRAEVRVVLGDARVSLEQERASGNLQRFDVLVLDTFSSDSIPVHLLTREALDLYLQHLAADGVIAAHVSNRHLDLTPVLWQLARERSLKIASLLVPAPEDHPETKPSQWILLARDDSLFSTPGIREAANRLTGFSTGIRPWTDDYSNLFQVLR